MADTERPSHTAARLLNSLRADRYIARNFADELFQIGSIIDAQDRLALSHAAGQEAESYWIGIVRRYRNPLQRFIRLHAQFDYDRDRNESQPRSAEDWAAVHVDRALSGHVAPDQPSTSAEVGRDAARYRKLKTMMLSADFEPEDYVGLTFALPAGTVVMANLDSILDGIDAAMAASSWRDG